jgi:hypothetical protein
MFYHRSQQRVAFDIDSVLCDILRGQYGVLNAAADEKYGGQMKPAEGRHISFHALQKGYHDDPDAVFL